MVNAHEVNGEVVYLIQPCHIGCKWTQANKHFRSSVWNANGELVSAAFPKFVNFGENPDNFPTPTSLNHTTIVEKIDGSLLSLTKYKGQFIIRTRGTVDATRMENGHEIELFKQEMLSKLPNSYIDFSSDTWPVSLLWEWTTPTNRIVLRYSDIPEWWLVGGVNHEDYSLWSQRNLDTFAYLFGFKRPATYTFSSISDLLENVDKWVGKEGVCLYSNKDQTIHKIKAVDYLCKHRLKEEFCNFERVLEFYIQQKCPSFSEFQLKISEVTDWETANEVVGDVSNCVDAWKEVQQIVAGMTAFVNNTLKPLPNRKEQAMKVLSSYSTTNRASMVFTILDGKELDQNQILKLFYQVLKK